MSLETRVRKLEARMRALEAVMLAPKAGNHETGQPCRSHLGQDAGSESESEPGATLHPREVGSPASC